MDFFFRNAKSYQSTYFLPTLFPGCTGVYVQTIDLFIVNNLQNMRMAAYKQPWRLSVYFTLYLWAIFTRIPTDMGHPNIHIFTIKS